MPGTIDEVCKELTVIMKDCERTYRHKFLIYEPLMMDPLNKVIIECIAEAMKSFGGEPDDVKIMVTMVI